MEKRDITVKAVETVSLFPVKINVPSVTKATTVGVPLQNKEYMTSMYLPDRLFVSWKTDKKYCYTDFGEYIWVPWPEPQEHVSSIDLHLP